MQKKLFFSKVVQMSMTMILLNISSICYGIFISSRSGADTVGIFHLIMSVHGLGISVSVSGMSITATRLISDIPLKKAQMQSDDIIRKCLTIAIITSTAVSVVLFWGADFISEKLLFRKECALCIRLLVPSLIFIAVSSVISGYFTAFAKTGLIFAGKVCAEAVGWLTTLFLFKKFSKENLYVAIVIATALSPVCECVINVISYTVSRISVQKQKSDYTYRHILSIASPLAVGSYLRTGLVSCENLLIPICLNYGNISDAMKKYGALKGMSMQILTFPYVFIGAFTTLIMPEIARRYNLGHKKSVKYISELSIDSIFKPAILVWTILLFWGKTISAAFFNDEIAGQYLLLLSFLPVFMYADSVTDAILKGLDKQLFALKTNIADSCVRIIVIFLIVPHFGIEGYVAIMYASEIFNFSISYYMLRKITNIRFSMTRSVLYPIFCSVVSVQLVKHLPVSGVIPEITICAGIYFAMIQMIKQKKPE